MFKLFESFKRFVDEEQLFESRLTDVKEKYPELGEYVDQLSKIDPSKNNKYLPWMARQLDNWFSGLTTDDQKQNMVSQISSLVQGFHKNAQRLKEKDINNYGHIGDLEKALQSLGVSSTAKRKKEKQEVVSGSSVVYEDDNFFIVRPETREASCYYGRQTRWCIAATKSENYFDRYSKEGKVFYFLNNLNLEEDDSAKKLAFVFGRDGDLEEIYDSPDDRINNNSAAAAIKMNLAGNEESLREDVRSDIEAGKVFDFRSIVNIMEKHLRDNPPDWVEDISARFKEILNSFYDNQPKHVSIFVDYDGEYPTFGGDLLLDIDVLWTIDPLKADHEKRNLIRKAIVAGLQAAHIYVSELNIEFDSRGSNDSGMITVPIETDGHSIEDFERYTQELLDIENRYEEILDRVTNVLADAGFVKGSPSQKAQQIAQSFPEFKNVKIALEGKEVTVVVPIKIDTHLKTLAPNFSGPAYMPKMLKSKQFQDSITAQLQKISKHARDFANKQLSLFERLMPSAIPNFDIVYSTFKNNILELELQIDIPWKETEEQVKLISSFAEYIDENYDSIVGIFAKTVGQMIELDK